MHDVIVAGAGPSGAHAARRCAEQGLDVLVLDALRDRPHPNHSTVEQSLALVEELRPQHAYFTHIAHDLCHTQTNARLPAGVALAYDGLAVEIEG